MFCPAPRVTEEPMTWVDAVPLETLPLPPVTTVTAAVPALILSKATLPLYVPAVGWKLPELRPPLLTTTVPEVAGCAPYMVTAAATGEEVSTEPTVIPPG